MVANLCLSAGFSPKKAAVQSREVSQLQLVAAEIGICIVPEEFRHILPKQVRLIALDAENAWSDVVMVWSKNADGVIQRCTEYMIKQFQR